MNFITPFLEWLIQCPTVAQNRVFLNAINAADDDIQVVTQEVSRAEDKEYIDGSVLHRVVFTIFNFKSISFNMLVKNMISRQENVQDLLAVGDISDWVVQQERLKNYPVLPEGYEIERIYPIYRTPSTPTIDNELARYSIPIVCEVLEYGN